MRKHLLPCALCLALCACGGFVKPEPGSENLVRMESEPAGCRLLYKIDSETSAYDPEDAERFLRNRINNQTNPGNAYWIISRRTRPIEGAIFGPSQSFALTANVYDCPDL